jgi:WD40 repeat protein
METAKEIQKWTVPAPSVSAVEFSSDERLVVSADSGGFLNMWNRLTGRAEGRIQVSSGAAQSLAISPRAPTAAVGQSNGTIVLVDLSQQSRIQVLKGHGGDVYSVAFGPEGQLLASGGRDGTVRLWSLESGRQIRSIEAHIFPVWSVAFSPDGSTLASGSMDRIVRTWDVATGTEKLKIGPAPELPLGHMSGVNCVVFSGDGKHLVSGSSDSTVRIWEVASR